MTLALLANAKPHDISYQVKDMLIPDFNVTADEARDMLLKHFKDKRGVTIAMSQVLRGVVSGKTNFVTPAVSSALLIPTIFRRCKKYLMLFQSLKYRRLELQIIRHQVYHQLITKCRSKCSHHSATHDLREEGKVSCSNTRVSKLRENRRLKLDQHNTSRWRGSTITKMEYFHQEGLEETSKTMESLFHQ